MYRRNILYRESALQTIWPVYALGKTTLIQILLKSC